MTDQKKIESLKFILREQISWYEKYAAEQDTGKLDGDYVYDHLYEKFNDLRRGDFVEIIEVLTGKI